MRSSAGNVRPGEVVRLVWSEGHPDEDVLLVSNAPSVTMRVRVLTVLRRGRLESFTCGASYELWVVTGVET